MKNSFNVLALDGGGIKGIRSLYVVAEIEKQTGLPAHHLFDLISGTSTGGIEAALLSVGFSANAIIRLYEEHGTNIFKKKLLRFGANKPKYDDDYLNFVIKRYVADKTLNDCLTGVMIPAYNIDTRDKVLFKNNGKQIYFLFDVIRATVSAQGYFAPHIINGERHIDGGNVMNNPSRGCYIEYLKKNVNKPMVVLNIGTGKDERPVKSTTNGGGFLFWAKPSVDILLTEQSDTVVYEMQKLNSAGLLSYTRIDPSCNYGNTKMDDASAKNLTLLKQDGSQTITENKQIIHQFITQIHG